MEASLTLKLMFAVLPIVLVIGATILVRSTKFILCLSLGMAFTGFLAGSGVLTDFEALPPRLLLLLLPVTLLTIFFAFSSIGTCFRDLSWFWLIGFQAFRLPLELMIYQAVAEGVAPPQFTWTGMNFDIIVGVISAFLAPFASRVPDWILWCWNVLGLALLINVVTVAIISTPGPLQWLEPDNKWIAYFPFVWLPTVCVMAALFGHLVATRKLLQKSVSTTNA